MRGDIHKDGGHGHSCCAIAWWCILACYGHCPRQCLCQRPHHRHIVIVVVVIAIIIIIIVIVITNTLVVIIIHIIPDLLPYCHPHHHRPCEFGTELGWTKFCFR